MTSDHNSWAVVMVTGLVKISSGGGEALLKLAANRNHVGHIEEVKCRDF